MLKHIKNNRGGTDIIAFIIVAPMTTWLLVFMIMTGHFMLRINEMNTIVNKYMNVALVQGQYDTTLKNQMITELDSAGFSASNLEIQITPANAGDANNTSYESRGTIIEVSVLYKKPHKLYKLLLSPGSESKYYIGTKLTGMSEKW